jgi:hypothetical protein
MKTGDCSTKTKGFVMLSKAKDLQLYSTRLIFDAANSMDLQLPCSALYQPNRSGSIGASF